MRAREIRSLCVCDETAAGVRVAAHLSLCADFDAICSILISAFDLPRRETLLAADWIEDGGKGIIIDVWP